VVFTTELVTLEILGIHRRLVQSTLLGHQWLIEVRLALLGQLVQMALLALKENLAQLVPKA
jgi:hypothetical protein